MFTCIYFKLLSTCETGDDVIISQKGKLRNREVTFLGFKVIQDWYTVEQGAESQVSLSADLPAMLC